MNDRTPLPARGAYPCTCALLAALFLLSLPAAARFFQSEPGGDASDFRVRPYLQNPSSTGMTVTWFTETPTPGRLTVAGPGWGGERGFTSVPTRLRELDYSALEESERADFPDMFGPENYKHQIVLTGLRPDSTYRYAVTQGDSRIEARFTTAPTTGTDRPLRFVVFADSETDPEGRKTYRDWAAGDQHPESDGRPEGQTQYLVTEQVGYAENLKIIRRREPDFLLLAGDIVQGGGYQRAWDEFWFHNAGKFDNPLSFIPLIPAMGNWENFGARNGGYEPQAIFQSRAKYAAYFDTPSNNNPDYQDRYYRIDYGPITILTLDSSNGEPDGTDADTNINIVKADYPGRDLPDINPGSDQWNWTLEQLADARAKGQVIFVQFHHVPYSSGGHILPTTAPGSSGQAGLPMRAYTPHFARYGVAAVFCGHNESFERSEVDEVLFYDTGVAGDGLGRPQEREDARFRNPYRKWVAHYDAPELWKGKQLLRGGRHYGHLEVEVTPVGEGAFEITFTPVHVFPVTDSDGKVIRFERRVYDDVVTRRVSAR